MLLYFYCCLVVPNFSLNEIHEANNLWEKLVMVWQLNLLECFEIFYLRCVHKT